MSKLVLDSIERIEMDTESPPLNNYHALGYLPVGLHSLALTVRNEELDVRKEPGGAPALMIAGFPNDAQIACCFNWFSTSIVNYLRLVGLIDIMNQRGWNSQDLQDDKNRKKITNHCVSYVKRVVPEIYKWRNKIAAHFAITDPSSKDNLGTLEYSIMNPIMYLKPYFVAGGFAWSIRGQKSQLEKWALTQTFENLTERLWPDRQLPGVE